MAQTLTPVKEGLKPYQLEELLNVNFKQLNENKLNEALESSIFDGIDLTPLFDTLIN